MRKKFEEDLAKLAFGDLDANDALRLELRSKQDPEASRTYESYCRMKDELRSLAVEVPADQLSKERLREAILARGLNDRKPEPARGSWVWVPAMAAVLAFGFMFMKGQLANQTGATAVVVDNSAKAPDLSIPRVYAPDPVSTFQAKVSPERSSIVSTRPSTVVAMDVPKASRNRRSGELMASRQRSEMDDLPMGAMSLSFANRASGEDSESSAASMDFGGREVSEPGVASGAGANTATTIVVIQPETDSVTGTHRATEVDSTANVIVGG